MAIEEKYDIKSVEAQANKWAKLASLTHDPNVRREILEVQHTYAELAAALRQRECLGSLAIVAQDPSSLNERHSAH